MSKALLISIAAMSVRAAGFGWFRPSAMVWERCVSSVLVECFDLNPC